MSKKIRYLIIALSAAFFFVAAPLIVLFVSGLKYDFNERKFVLTGILTVQTEPENVEVYLDNKLVKASSGEIRFLKSGNYQLILKKSGYLDWRKTLPVEAGKVTRANATGGKILLFLKEPAFQEMQNRVFDFTAWQEGLVAISGQELLVSSAWDFNKAEHYNLPKVVSKILPSENFKFFLLTQEPALLKPPNILLFDSVSKKIFDLSPLFKNQNKLPQFAFSKAGRLFGLEDQLLFELEPKNLTKRLILSGIKNFYIRDQTLYYLSQNESGVEISSLDLETGQISLLLTGLPEITHGAIVLNAQKRIFLLADGALFTASTEGLSKLANNLTFWENEDAGQALTYLSASELWYADGDARVFFVTRMSVPLSLPKILPSLGYAFYIRENKLVALELDHTGEQNSYELYTSANINKYKLNQDGTAVLILDNDRLGLLRIR